MYTPRRLNESAMGNALEQKFVQMRHPLFVTLVVQEPLETLALHLRVAQQFLDLGFRIDLGYEGVSRDKSTPPHIHFQCFAIICGQWTWRRRPNLRASDLRISTHFLQSSIIPRSDLSSPTRV
jgi:hypothetical protein